MRYNFTILIIFLVWFIPLISSGQTAKLFYPALFQHMEWKPIGTAMGGEATVVVGVNAKPMVYYAGYKGGGLWKTIDGGVSWTNCSDHIFSTTTISAIAIASNNPNIVYVGTGQSMTNSNLFDEGSGLYRSIDGGQTWKNIGLQKAKNIVTISINPTDEDDVVVAVQGADNQMSQQRGIFRTTDGGINWLQTLYKGESVGATTISRDTDNPSLLYANLWEYEETAWRIKSGGERSAIFASEDGGNNWTKLQKDLPNTMGKNTIACASGDNQVLYLLQESENSGLYKSIDNGESWILVNTNTTLTRSAWKYTKLAVDPSNSEIVYVLNDFLWKSIDGGKSFSQITTASSAHYDFWVNTQNTSNIAIATDKGVSISFNGGTTWSLSTNQPTGHINAIAEDPSDTNYLYFIQEGRGAFKTSLLTNRTESIPLPKIDNGQEYGTLCADQDAVYLTRGQGDILLYDRTTEIVEDISPFPSKRLGVSPRNQEYRFNFNGAIAKSPLDDKQLFAAANVVLKSKNNGENWQVISPDLTRNEVNKQGRSTGPFNGEVDGRKTYNTISSLVCSPIDTNVIWVGTDDGLIHYTKNGGKKWYDVTPKLLGQAYVEAVVISSHNANHIYVLAHKFKTGIQKSFVLVSTDNGKTWNEINKGIRRSAMVTSLLEDPTTAGILYLGTNKGLYASIDQGGKWKKFENNLPLCYINDILIVDNNLVVATKGRGLWMLEQLAPLQKSMDLVVNRENKLFALPVQPIEQAKKYGVYIDYYLTKSLPKSMLSLVVKNNKGQTIKTFSTQEITNFKGVNRIFWNWRKDDLPISNEDVSYLGSLTSIGEYQIVLTAENNNYTIPLIVENKQDKYTHQQYILQRDKLMQIDAAIVEIYQSTASIIEVQQQLENLLLYLERLPQSEELVQYGKEIVLKISLLTNELVPLKIENPQDVVAYPNTLSEEMDGLRQRIELSPKIANGIHRKWLELDKQWKIYDTKITKIIEEDIAAFNQQYKKQGIPALIVLNK